jgi:starvation-inducible outer membrane lipoprotein
MKLPCAFILAMAFALAGCPSTPSAVESANQQLEMQGSPFRYIAQATRPW